MTEPISFIFNPNANLARAREMAPALRATAEQLGGGDWRETSGPGDATRLAAEAAAAGARVVVALGGDGTVHEVLNGIMQAPAATRPALAVVPVGSGNDFSFAAGVLPDPQAAMRRVFNGERCLMDIGTVEDGDGRREYWCNAVGIGFDTIVTIHTRSMKALKGFVLYFGGVLKSILVSYESFNLKVKMDDQEWSDALMMLVLCNGKREGGGFMVAPEGKTDDGWFDISGVSKISRLRMLATLPYFMKGTQSTLKYVRGGKFRRLSLESDFPLRIHTDGEIWSGFDSNTRCLTVQMLPGVLEVQR